MEAQHDDERRGREGPLGGSRRNDWRRHVEVKYKPRLLSGNGPCFIAKELAEYLLEMGISHTRGKSFHRMPQEKIERYHRSTKNVINLQKYFYP